ncbi:MAG TPA: protocatechuate 3,4-dioxygenase subunit alpha [Nocardioidaceae bacterium]|nr:protocatechuate 3,4-dioxygenase subunit alpha [Nocardioidaceae bacterium]
MTTPTDARRERVATPGQTIGPFFGYALPYPGGGELVPPGQPGAIRLHGVVLDGADVPIGDALIEVWQADAAGEVVQRPGSLNRDGFTFTGWGRVAVDAAGWYSFSTIRPGPTRDGGAPFFALTVLARGLLNRLFTRAYLPLDPAVLAADPLLRQVEPDRRDTLVATEDETGYRFDIRLQGDGETVFLAYPGP